MDDDLSLFSKQFTGNTSLYFFLYKYRQPLYLTRNLDYLYLETNKKHKSDRQMRCLDSFVFEKEMSAKNTSVWTIYISHLKIPKSSRKKDIPASLAFHATLFLYCPSGQCLYQKSIHGNAIIDFVGNLLFQHEELFKVPYTVFKMRKGGIKIDRACIGRLIFTMSDNEIIFVPSISNISEPEDSNKDFLEGMDLEMIKKRGFFYVTFNIPCNKTSCNFNVSYFDENGNRRQTECMLSLCFMGKLFQDTKLDLDSKISLRSKLPLKHNIHDMDEKIEIRYVFKAEDNNETVVGISTRRDFQCPWCQGRNFHTKQRLHFHFLMNHELFSFKLEIDNFHFLQFEIKLASEYPFKRISEQNIDFRVFQWIKHIKFKHNIKSILSDNGESILFRNTMLGMDVDQNKSLRINVKPKQRTQLFWPLEKKIKRKFVAPNMDNLYRTISKRKIIPGEILSESEDDIDETWLIQKHEDMIDDFMDITLSEKAFMKLWNRFIIKDRPIGHCHLPDSIMRFVYSHKNILHAENLVNEFWKHLLNLIQYKMIDLVTLRKSMEVIRNIHSETTN